MAKSTTNASQETSPKSQAVDLSHLTKALESLLASVKVTASTPIARTNPQLAIESMAEMLLNFPIGLTKSVIEDMRNDPDAVWPTSGQMVAIMRDTQVEQSKPKPSANEADWNVIRRSSIYAWSQIVARAYHDENRKADTWSITMQAMKVAINNGVGTVGGDGMALWTGEECLEKAKAFRKQYA